MEVGFSHGQAMPTCDSSASSYHCDSLSMAGSRSESLEDLPAPIITISASSISTVLSETIVTVELAVEGGNQVKRNMYSRHGYKWSVDPAYLLGTASKQQWHLSVSPPGSPISLFMGSCAGIATT